MPTYIPVHVGVVIGACGLEDHECALQAAQMESAVLLKGAQAICDDLGHIAVHRFQFLVLSRDWNEIVEKNIVDVYAYINAGMILFGSFYLFNWSSVSKNIYF